MKRKGLFSFWLFSVFLLFLSEFNSIAFATTTSQSNSETTQREPMNTTVKSIDDTNVLFQYNQPVPSFDTWGLEQKGREYMSLDGQWKYLHDPNSVGMDEGWHKAAYDDSDWQREQVPGSWDLYNTEGFGSYDGTNWGEGSAFDDGHTWFRKHIEPSSTWKNKFIKLNFLGVNYKTWVYVNGNLVGEHEGGHTPFSLDVSAHLKPGEDNVIAVRVYRRPWFDSYTAENPTPISNDSEVPYKEVDYWPYAGITRSVYLEATSQVTVSKLLIESKKQKMDIYAVLFNHGKKPETRMLVLDPGEGTGGKSLKEEVKLAPGEVKVVKKSIAIPNAKTWDTNDPNIYTATASLFKGIGNGQLIASNGSLDDSLSADYGMRTLTVEDAKLKLNGRQIFLKGVNWHEETAANGRSMTIEEYNKELNTVLDVNANFIRNSVYNRHPYVYEFANENGLLVMDDIDNMWLNTPQQKLQTESYGLSRALALKMAWNQVNNPSVILWGLQNESEIWSDIEAYRSWIADMKQAVKQLDIQDRPVTWASGSSWDPAFDLADVIGFNEYFGYFYGSDRDLGPTIDSVHERYPDKPILITENGTWSIYGDHGPATQVGTEEWQAQKFVNHWEQILERKDYLAGYTFWVLKDYKTRMLYNKAYNGISAMGLTTFGDQHKRLIYYQFRNAENPNP